MSSRPLLAYFGHHKCASQWISGILRSICKATGRHQEVVYGMDDANRDLARFVARRGIDFLIYANVIPEHIAPLTDVRGVHIVRDPRDVMVSGYFSHLKTHVTGDWPELLPHREQLQRVPKDEGLFLEFEFSGFQVDRMARWNYRQPHVLELRLEDMIGNEQQSFVEVARFLGLLDDRDGATARRLIARTTEFLNRVHARTNGWSLLRRRGPIASQRLTQIVHAHRFAAKTAGREPGQEDTGSHYRKGTPGDWRNHFGPAHVAHFKARWGRLLIDLGYERDCDW
ncbi:MAG: sulfotransferase domain-containing protein [Planctomycetes bacterium]|nr:sulfotransferase domain-containing protein [Planctomycetota bacterium]